MAATGTALWPSTATYPDTTQYPGQGGLPIARCKLSFDDVATAIPSWTEVASSKFRDFSVSRGRNSELNEFDAGSATVTLDNRDRAYDPTTNASITPMNRIWLYEEFSGEVHDLFHGYVEVWDQQWPGGGWSDAVAVLSCTDEFKLLSLDGMPSSGTLASAWSHTQVAAVLDLSSSSKASRRLQAGATNSALQSQSYTGQSPITLIRSIESAEKADGAFFVAADGALVLLNSAHRSASPYNTSQATFGDAGGAELAYLGLDIDYSDAFIANDVTVSSSGGTPRNVTDLPSITKYGHRPLSYTNIPLAAGAAGDTDASSIAGAEVTKYKNPLLRVINLSFDTIDASVSEAYFRRELMDRITVKRTPPGGGARISQDLFIQKVDIAGDNSGAAWTMSWGVSPL